jgi:hypothetical protein
MFSSKTRRASTVSRAVEAGSTVPGLGTAGAHAATARPARSREKLKAEVMQTGKWCDLTRFVN